MKKQHILFAALFAFAFIFTSCEDEGPEVYSGNDNFHFLQQTSNADESSPLPIVIPVVFTKSVAKSGSVSFTVSSATAVENLDYIVLNTNTTFDFSDGEYFDTIRIQPIDNQVLDGDKEIVITLTGGTEALGWPGPDALNSTHTFTILDDDCAVPLIGAFTESSVGGGGDGAGGIGVPVDPFTYGAVLNVTKVSCDGDGKYQIDDITMGLYQGLWGAPSGTPATFINNGGSITIIEAESPDLVYAGDAFFGTGGVTDNDNFSLNWSNSYGDQGASNLSRQ